MLTRDAAPSRPLRRLAGMIGSWSPRLALASAALLAFGAVWLLAYVVAEALVGDGQGSLVDAYWRGRLPWMGIAEALIVVGATACAASGALATFVNGGWIRRVATLPPLGIIGLWWWVATVPFPGGAYCPTCAPPMADPWAYAYSVPETTLVFLIGPAVLILFLALARRAIGSGRTNHPLESASR